MLTDRDSPLVTLQDVSATPVALPGPACFVSIYGPKPRQALVAGSARDDHRRDGNCDVPLPIDTVSRRHCRVRASGNAVFLTDLGSTNGTALNDDVLAANEEFALRSGDKVRVGSAILKFLRGDDVESLYHEEIYRTMIADGLTGRRQPPLPHRVPRARDGAQPPPSPHAVARALRPRPLQAGERRLRHLTGDEVLRTVAAIAREQVRREDCFARFGGEEFAVV
jgi:hypothetical protein